MIPQTLPDQPTHDTPRAGQGCTQLGVTQGTTEGGYAANQPQQEKDRRGLQLHQLKPQTGEHTGPDHIGDDNSRGNGGLIARQGQSLYLLRVMTLPYICPLSGGKPKGQSSTRKK